MIGISISVTIRDFSKLENVNDVSEKYSMTTFIENFNLSSDFESKKYITFNSEYDTYYVVDYDNRLENEIKIEVKYYECYYDMYIKNGKEIYLSLAVDYRDLLSVYIENLKERKIFNNDELKRYNVRIIMNEKDKDRIIINN